MHGLLAGLEPEALAVRVGARNENIESTDILKVTLETSKDTLPYMLIGMSGGIYLEYLLFRHADNQPVQFIRTEDRSVFGVLFTDAVYAAAGMGAGYLASLFEKSLKVFYFSGSRAARLAEWEKLRDFLSGISGPRRVHLSLHSGYVFPSSSKSYRNLMEKADYRVLSGYSTGVAHMPGYAEAAGNFNLLRGIRLTYSIKPRLEVGAAVHFQGEPGQEGYFYAPASDLTWNIIQTYDSTAYHVVASYNLGSPVRGGFQWKVGLGAGAARVKFDLSLTESQGYPVQFGKTDGFSLVKTEVCSLLFTEIHVFLYRSLSVGVVADYIMMPSEEIPAFPEWNLPGQTIRPGNGSAWFSLGWHF
jgi:hypothetical protein